MNLFKTEEHQFYYIEFLQMCPSGKMNKKNFYKARKDIQEGINLLNKL